MKINEAISILEANGFCVENSKLDEAYGQSDKEILADPDFWDYSKKVQQKYKNYGGFIIKPSEQKYKLENPIFLKSLKDNYIRLPKQFIMRFTQPFVEKIILACYKKGMNVNETVSEIEEFSIQAGSMTKPEWLKWIAEEFDALEESVYGNSDKKILNEGIQYNLYDCQQKGWVKNLHPGKAKFTYDWDVVKKAELADIFPEMKARKIANMYGEEVLKAVVSGIYESVNEDFGMGVGAPLGADQGIPHGGDCIAVPMMRLGDPAPHGKIQKLKPHHEGAAPFWRRPSMTIGNIIRKKKRKKKKR